MGVHKAHDRGLIPVPELKGMFLYNNYYLLF